MKNINKSILSFFLVVVFIATSCTKDFPAINSNPTALTEGNFNPNSLLTSVQLTYTGSTDFAFEAWRTNLGMASTMTQLFATTFGSWAGDKYTLNNEYMHAYWNRAYPEQVKTVVELVEFTRNKPEYANLHQIGRLMKAMVFQRITDLYGDVPYFQAGLAYHDRLFYPVYDKQELIYADLFKEIEEASNALSTSGDKITGDAMFGGDISKWQRFGNTLLLRAAMRLVKVDEAVAKSVARKALGKTMISNDDNAFVRGSGPGVDRTVNNRYAQVLLGDSGGGEHFYTKWSKTFIDFLKNHDDPRLTRIARVHVWTGSNPNSVTQNNNPSGDAALQKGMPNGKNTSQNNDGFSIYYDPSYTGTVNDPAGLNNYSSINLDMVQRNSPTFFLTYAESEFLLAEAAVRWGAEYGNPKTHYENGVKASMSYLSQYNSNLAITAAEIDGYLAKNPYMDSKGLELINTQYWAETGTGLNFYEAWTNWRRTGYPVLTPIDYPGNITGGTIPRRLTYPLGEASANEDNLNAARNSILGGDFITSRVWWDKL